MNISGKRIRDIENIVEDLPVVDRGEREGGFDSDDLRERLAHTVTHETKEVNGILADDIRKALGAPSDSVVMITERRYETGTEETQEWEDVIILCCAGQMLFFEEEQYPTYNSAIVNMIRWIEQEHAKLNYREAGKSVALMEGEL